MLVTPVAIGSNGRLGNQLFQLANSIAYAKRFGMNLGLPAWNCGYTGVNMLDVFCVYDRIPGASPSGAWSEPHYSYSPIPHFPLGVSMHGYFQSEMYFSDQADHVRIALLPTSSTLSAVDSSASACSADRDVCAVHVRRGDYVRLQDYHPVYGVEYYRAAMDEMRARGAKRFVIFSDDLEWCQRNLSGGDAVTHTSGVDYVDLLTMARCGFHVIANSSFSWWSAWLSGSDHVIAPVSWFGPSGPKDGHTVVPNRWLRMG